MDVESLKPAGVFEVIIPKFRLAFRSKNNYNRFKTMSTTYMLVTTEFAATLVRTSYQNAQSIQTPADKQHFAIILALEYQETRPRPWKF